MHKIFDDMKVYGVVHVSRLMSDHVMLSMTKRRGQLKWRQVDTRGLQSRRIGYVRRRHPGDAAPLQAKIRQSRQGDSEFTQPLALDHDFGQRSQRPPTAGQQGIKRHETTGYGVQACRAIRRTPERRVAQQSLQRIRCIR